MEISSAKLLNEIVGTISQKLQMNPPWYLYKFVRMNSDWTFWCDAHITFDLIKLFRKSDLVMDSSNLWINHQRRIHFVIWESPLNLSCSGNINFASVYIHLIDIMCIMIYRMFFKRPTPAWKHHGFSKKFENCNTCIILGYYHVVH